MSNATERSIFEQFRSWRDAPQEVGRAVPALPHVVIGCGTSFNIALSLAACLNLQGVQAIAASGSEWSRRPGACLPRGRRAQVLALSRSGESTETVQAAEASRRDGHAITAVTRRGHRGGDPVNVAQAGPRLRPVPKRRAVDDGL
jgi:glucosamine--fructose-6-phosphate aminotransferase (isomerizing)